MRPAKNIQIAKKINTGITQENSISLNQLLSEYAEYGTPASSSVGMRVLSPATFLVLYTTPDELVAFMVVWAIATFVISLFFIICFSCE